MLTGMELQSLVILSLKNFRKEFARVDVESEFGNGGGISLPNKESMTFHSFLGLLLLSAMMVR